MISGFVESIFPTYGLTQDVCRWRDYLDVITPVQRVGELQFKRDDAFAPLGYGGINGSKLRQLIYLVDNYVKEGNPQGVLTGASVLSPQLAMGAAVARQYDLPALLIVGSTTPKAAIRNEMVQLAAWFGARFDYSTRVGYNPVLQRACQRLLTEKFPGWFYLEYGITRDHTRHSPQSVLAFHNIGGRQAENIPDDVEDLVIAAGSCNSCTSLMRGLALHPKPNLRRLHLIGIGPPKLQLINDRLRIFEELTGVCHRLFRSTLEGKYDMLTGGHRHELRYDDLHTSRLVRYHDPQPYYYKGIAFHPTYEGKVMTHLMQRRPELVKPTTLVWIVGSAPDKEVMAGLLHGVMGACPKVAKSYDD